MSDTALQTDYVEMPVGTLEEGLAMIGYETEPVRADIPLERGLILAYTSLLEDPNPAYWDEAVSKEYWDCQIAPSGVLKTLFMGLRWYPGEKTQIGSLAASLVPLPADTLINVAAEETFYRPLRLGDWLSYTEKLVSISPEKKTALGPGYFITTELTYRDQNNELVAVGTNVLLRYRSKEGNN